MASSDDSAQQSSLEVSAQTIEDISLAESNECSSFVTLV